MVLNIIITSLIVSIISSIVSKLSIIISIIIILISILSILSIINTWFSIPKKTRNPGHANHVLETPL